VDRLVDAHRSAATWQIKQCKERAGEFTTNAKRPADGFDLYRGKLAAVFSVWGRRFEKLDKDEGKRIKDTLTEYRSTALDCARNYDIHYIGPSPARVPKRAQVQRDAATEVAMDFIDATNKVEPQITGNLSTVFVC
jgi:hypothetical protein